MDFYHDLIHNSSPPKIILEVNRILKSFDGFHNKDIHKAASNFLKEAIKVFKLDHDNIQCLISGSDCVVQNKNILGSFSFLFLFDILYSIEERKAEVISNHPVHLVDENGNLSLSAFIPFCGFGGDLSSMGVRIDQFDLPVCNSFGPTIFKEQLCYEVDLNLYKNMSNIENQLKEGFIFLFDNNEDKVWLRQNRHTLDLQYF